MNRPTARTGGPASFLQRTTTVTVGQVAVKGSQVVITLVLVRLLAPAEWTRMAYILSIYLAAVTLGTLNLQQGIIFFASRVADDRRRALVAQTAALLAVVAAVIAAGLVVARPVLTSDRLDIAAALPLLGGAILLELPTVCGPALFVATGQLGAAAMWDVGMTLVQIACFVVPAALGGGVSGVMVGMLVGATIRAIAFAGVLLRFPGPVRGLPAGTLVAQLRYGLPLGITMAASVLNRSVDKWFIAVFDPTHVGVYAVAAQEIPLLAVLPYAGGVAVVTQMVDAFRTGDRPGAHRIWLQLTASMATVVVPMSLLLIVITPEVLTLALPHDPGVVQVPFQLFTAITLHRVAEYGLVLRAADRNKDLVRASVLLLSANVVCAGVGAATLGMVGASAGTLLANAIAWLFVLTRLGRAFDVTIRRAFAWGPWVAALIASASAAIAAEAASRALTSSTAWALAVKVTVFACVYLAATRRASTARATVRDGRTPVRAAMASEAR